MKNSLRSDGHKKDPALEILLEKLNSVLLEPELNEVKNYEGLRYAPVFIVGNPRSGTTLVYQYLSRSRCFSYPSNIISRFYNAPYIGALVHRIFLDCDNKGEIFGTAMISDQFVSKLGKTVGAESPNEFWYFWRRFFKFGEIHKMSERDLEDIDIRVFINELAAFESVFDKPVLMKAMIMNWNLEYLISKIPEAIIVFVKRDPLYNMYSLYQARNEFFGNINEWYSFKPPEYLFLKDKDVYEQLAGQVIFTNNHLENILSTYSGKIVIQYEDFCKNPENSLDIILEKYPDMKPGRLDMNTSSIAARTSIESDDFNVTRAKEAISKIDPKY